jgi:hypothetical protein
MKPQRAVYKTASISTSPIDLFSGSKNLHTRPFQWLAGTAQAVDRHRALWVAVQIIGELGWRARLSLDQRGSVSSAVTN